MKAIISIANSKGGTGKTIVSANLAWELARNGHNVLVIDLDQQADLTKLLLPDVAPDDPNILNVLQKTCPVIEACLPVKTNLDIIPGTRDIKFFTESTGINHLNRILKARALKKYDLIIIDHPPSTNEVTVLGYAAATHVLIVTDPEAFSISNIHLFLQDLKVAKVGSLSGTKILGILFNRVDFRRALPQQAIKQLRLSFGSTIFNTHIGNNSTVPISVDRRLPLRELEQYGPTLKQFVKLSHEVEERLGL